MRLGHLSGRHRLLIALLSSALRLVQTRAHAQAHKHTHTLACVTYFGAANLSYLAAAAPLLILKAYFFVFHNEIKVEGVEPLALYPSDRSVADVSLLASLLLFLRQPSLLCGVKSHGLDAGQVIFPLEKY